jgi:hypothetical protein
VHLIHGEEAVTISTARRQARVSSNECHPQREVKAALLLIESRFPKLNREYAAPVSSIHTPSSLGICECCNVTVCSTLFLPQQRCAIVSITSLTSDPYRTIRTIGSINPQKQCRPGGGIACPRAWKDRGAVVGQDLDKHSSQGQSPGSSMCSAAATVPSQKAYFVQFTVVACPVMGVHWWKPDILVQEWKLAMQGGTSHRPILRPFSPCMKFDRNMASRTDYCYSTLG